MANEEVSNPKYRDWLKGGLATKFLRNGIVSLVNRTSKNHHFKMLKDIEMQFGSEAVAGCTVCELRTLKPLHSKDKDGNCGLGQKHHCNCLNVKGKQLCPTNFCSAMYDKIIIQHRLKTPNWKNTDIRQWHSNHWQIAKCSIPTGGYVEKISAMDTDTSGLLSVIIHNLEMQNVFGCTIDPPHDILSKTRKARNEIFHSTELELEEHTLQIYINDMISILDDGMVLSSRPEAAVAKQQLEQLRENKLEVSVVDEKELRKVSLEAIDEKINVGLQELEKKRSEIVSEFNTGVFKNIKAQLTILQDKNQDLSTQQEYDELKMRFESMEEQVQSVENGLQAFGSRIDCNDQDTEIQRIQVKIKSLDEKLYEETLESSSELTDTFRSIASNTRKVSQELMEIRQDFNKLKLTKEMYAQTRQNHEKQIELLSQKQALKRDLIFMYQKYKTKTSVQPMYPDEEIDVSNIYEKPHIAVAKSREQTEKDQLATKADHCVESHMGSYKEMFGKVDGRNIYISGDAGMGKSTFCKYLIQQWCKIHQEGNKEASKQIFEDPDVLRAFEYLFYVTLCHMSKENHVHDMIRNHVLKSSLYKGLFDKIVDTESERCLIILDGLDEWIPVGTDNRIPQRNLMKKYTILTTTRPWKMEEARLETSEIDIHAKVHGLTGMSSNQYIGSVVHHLNIKLNRFKNDSDFLRVLTCHGLSDMKSVPVVLQQLICLWHDGNPLGNSLCDTYSNMTDLLFNVAGYKRPNVEEICTKQLPNCFHNNDHCLTNKSLLFKLAEFSFKTLFPADREPSLVFDRSTAHNCGMTSEDIDFFLKIGLLTECKITGISASKRLTSLSFLHKTFQEFLAAVFISDHDQVSQDGKHSNRQQQLFQTCKTTSAILEMGTVFIFVSGMNPNVAKQLSRHIQLIVGSNEKVKKYREDFHRNQLQKEQYDKVFSELKQVCNLVTRCIEETLNARSYMTVETESCMYLSDLIYDNETTIQPRWIESQLRCLLCIDTEFMESVYVRGDDPVLQTLRCLITNCTSLKKFEVLGLIYDSDSMKIRFAEGLLKLEYDLMTVSRNTLVHSSLELGANGNDLHMLFQENRDTMVSKRMVLNIKHVPYKHKYLENALTKLGVPTEIILVDTYCTEHVLGTCPLKLQLPGFHLLQTLVLENLYLDGIEIPKYMANLKLLSLINFDFSHRDLEDIVFLAQNATKLREIHLQRLNCVDHKYGECSILLQLQSHIDLQCVDLQYTPFHVRVEQATLQHFCMKESIIEPILLKGLAHAQSLENLFLSQTPFVPIEPRIATALTEILPRFQQLEKIELMSIDFGDTTPKLSNKLQNLKHVLLRSCTMTENAFYGFLGSIPKVKHKLRVDILFCRIPVFTTKGRMFNVQCCVQSVFENYTNAIFKN